MVYGTTLLAVEKACLPEKLKPLRCEKHVLCCFVSLPNEGANEQPPAGAEHGTKNYACYIAQIIAHISKTCMQLQQAISSHSSSQMHAVHELIPTGPWGSQ